MAAAKPSIPVLSWDTIRPAPVVLVSGPERFLADRSIRILRELLRQEDPSLEYNELDAGDYAPGELLTLASPSLFGEPRLLRVDAVEKANDAFLDDAIAYLQSPEPSAYIILRHAGGVRGKRLLEAVRSGLGNGIEVPVLELKKEQDRLDFARAELRTAGKKVTIGALRALVQAFGEDTAALGSACQQLAADVAAEITEDVIDRYYGGRIETNAFKVADAALAGRGGEALILLRHALASGADPVPIVAAFASKLRGMGRVSGAHGPVGQVAGELGMAPWMVERARRDLQGWTEQGLARCIQFTAETDAQVKGAGRDPVYAIERLVQLLASRGTALG